MSFRFWQHSDGILMEEDVKVLAKLLRSQVQQLIKERDERNNPVIVASAVTPAVVVSAAAPVAQPIQQQQQQQPTPVVVQPQPLVIQPVIQAPATVPMVRKFPSVSLSLGVSIICFSSSHLSQEQSITIQQQQPPPPTVQPLVNQQQQQPQTLLAGQPLQLGMTGGAAAVPGQQHVIQQQQQQQVTANLTVQQIQNQIHQQQKALHHVNQQIQQQQQTLQQVTQQIQQQQSVQQIQQQMIQQQHQQQSCLIVPQQQQQPQLSQPVVMEQHPGFTQPPQQPQQQQHYSMGPDVVSTAQYFVPVAEPPTDQLLTYGQQPPPVFQHQAPQPTYGQYQPVDVAAQQSYSHPMAQQPTAPVHQMLNYVQQPTTIDQVQMPHCPAPETLSYPVQQQQQQQPVGQQYTQQVVYLQQPIQQLVQQSIDPSTYIHLPAVQQQQQQQPAAIIQPTQEQISYIPAQQVVPQMIDSSSYAQQIPQQMVDHSSYIHQVAPQQMVDPSSFVQQVAAPQLVDPSSYVQQIPQQIVDPSSYVQQVPVVDAYLAPQPVLATVIQPVTQSAPLLAGTVQQSAVPSSVGQSVGLQQMAPDYTGGYIHQPIPVPAVHLGQQPVEHLQTYQNITAPLEQAIYVQQPVDQTVYVQPPVEQLVALNQSYIQQQPMESTVVHQVLPPPSSSMEPAVLVDRIDLPHADGIATPAMLQVAPSGAHSSTTEIPLYNQVLQAMAAGDLYRSGTPEPGACGQCCSDVYTTDSCGESSAAECADVVPAPGFVGANAPANAANLPTAGEKRLARRLNSKRRRTVERGPRLSVLSVQGSVVEYQLETMKQKTVTFKFDQTDTVPSDVANNLIRHGLLSEQHADIFIEQVTVSFDF